MRFFERASPKQQDPFDALLQYLDGQCEEFEERRIAEMQYGWKSHQGRNTNPMEREDHATIVVVLLLLVAVISMLLIALQRTA